MAAWVIGARASQKALLLALLEPLKRLRQFEEEGDCTSRLALTEEAKALPFGEVWNEFCRRQNVPEGFRWMETLKRYEAKILSLRR
jgi:L-rhamnose isomerase